MIERTSNGIVVKNRWVRLLDGLILYIPFVLASGLFIWALITEILRVEISQEGRASIYSTLGTITFYTCILLNTIYGRKYGLGWLRCLIFSLASFYLIHVYTSQGMTWLDIQIFGEGAIISARSLIVLPLLCLILARFCKVDSLNLCDFLTPYYFFHHGVVTVACWFRGCCAGNASSWGLLNPLSGATVFPTQPCIILLSVCIAFWGLFYAKKNAYKTNGIVLANSLCFYGIGRYIIELFSDDARVWWALSWISICSIVMIIEGFMIRYISKARYKTSS